MNETIVVGLSCIVSVLEVDPWGPAEVQRLASLKGVFDEVLLVSSDHNLSARLPANFRRVQARRGTRARLLNVAAKEAKEDFLCFLSPRLLEFDPSPFSKLRFVLRPQRLYYFDVDIDKAALKSCLANLKARVFGLPPLLHSYVLDRESFLKIGGYSENIVLGEDIDFLRRWKRQGFALCHAKGEIHVSKVA